MTQSSESSTVYRTIVADPPWHYESTPHGVWLFMWTTNRYLPDAFNVVNAWGFEYRQTIVWAKPSFPIGGCVTPNAAEYLLVGRRGTVRLKDKWPGGSVVTAPKGAKAGSHSSKPEVFLDLVERVAPGPYLEMFARRARFGWDYWGDQSLGTAEMAA
jgi:N6-adenosine-specific RNA methylase IME4